MWNYNIFSVPWLCYQTLMLLPEATGKVTYGASEVESCLILKKMTLTLVNA